MVKTDSFDADKNEIPRQAKMPYVTNGSVHHTGVHTEHSLVDQLTACVPERLAAAYPEQPLTFAHRGGTRAVEDIAILGPEGRVGGISVKHHAGSGTFDYINTSKVAELLPAAEEVSRELGALRTTYRGQADALPTARSQVRALIHRLWVEFPIRSLLRRIHERNPEWVAVVSPSGLHLMSHDDLKELSYYPYDEKTTYELRGMAQGSRQIWRITDGVAVNTHLRVRLVLNNGVGALLGLSASNKSSVLTLKIQQDNVRGLLRQGVPA